MLQGKKIILDVIFSHGCSIIKMRAIRLSAIINIAHSLMRSYYSRKDE